MKTSKQILARLVKILSERYAAELEKLPLKPKVRETLCDGFKDGARVGVFEACKMLEVEILDVPDKAEGDTHDR